MEFEQTKGAPYLAKVAYCVHEHQLFGNDSIYEQPEQPDRAIDCDRVADILGRDSESDLGALQAQADQWIVALVAAVA